MHIYVYNIKTDFSASDSDDVSDQDDKPPHKPRISLSSDEKAVVPYEVFP